jgi:hypothetical protein
MLAQYRTSTMESCSIFATSFAMGLGCTTSIGCARSGSHDDALHACAELTSVDRTGLPRWYRTYDRPPSSFIGDGLLRSPASFNCDDCCCYCLTSLPNLGDFTAHEKFRAATRTCLTCTSLIRFARRTICLFVTW